MTSQDIVNIVAILYCVANLGSMGLELNFSKAVNSLRNPRLVIPTLVWSWIVGPAVAYLLTRILPLSESHAIGLLVIGLAPTAPLLPILIRKAKADMDVAAAMIPLAVVGTVIFMPLLAPLLIPGASASSAALAWQLFLTVLLPLVVGVAINVYAGRTAAKIFPYVKKSASLTTLALLVFTVILYGREFLQALGSFAAAAQVLWGLVIGLLSYWLGFGLGRTQRSALALGVCSRNGGVTLIAFAALPTRDPDVLVMLLLGIPVPVVLWLILAVFFANRMANSYVRE